MHDLVPGSARAPAGGVLVTHDVDEAILLADRVLVLSDGSIGLNVPVEIDKPRQRDDPRFLELRGRLLAQLGVAHTVGGTDPEPEPPPG